MMAGRGCLPPSRVRRATPAFTAEPPTHPATGDPPATVDGAISALPVGGLARWPAAGRVQLSGREPGAAEPAPVLPPLALLRRRAAIDAGADHPELGSGAAEPGRPVPAAPSATIRRSMGFEYELDSLRTRHTDSFAWNPWSNWVQHGAGDRMQHRAGYDITADIGDGYSRVEFVTDAFDEHTQLPALQQVVQDVRDDIDAMRRVSLAHESKGYLAGTPLGGTQGWWATDRWVGLDRIPRLGGSWREQVEFAASPNSLLSGQLQLTGGFTIDGLERLVSGRELGDVRIWPKGWQQDVRQFLTAYAHLDAPSDLYRRCVDAVKSWQPNRARLDGPAAERAQAGIAAVLSVMAQAPIAYRNAGTEAGLLIAKTDYAGVLAQLHAQTGAVLDADRLLGALLDVVNSFVGEEAGPDSPVFRGDDELDLGRVSFARWIAALLPPASATEDVAVSRDLMTRQHYPGTTVEKTALRTYGPYGDRVDPGGKAIFELRSLIMNPVADLADLTDALADLMRGINRPAE